MAGNRSIVFENCVAFAARLPWWTGVVLAVVSFLGLHRLAGVVVPVSNEPGSVMHDFVLPFVHGSAIVLQVVLPGLFLAGAGIAVWRRYKHRKNYADVASERGLEALEMLSWREFENLVGEYFRRKGFSIEQRGGRAPDRSVDLVACIGPDRYLVQCKHWRVQRVGVRVVRDLCSVAATEGAAGVFVVTSGSFTDEARKFVEENRIDIELISGDQLQRMIRGLAETAQTG